MAQMGGVDPVSQIVSGDERPAIVQMLDLEIMPADAQYLAWILHQY